MEGNTWGWRYRGTILVGGYMGGVKIWRLEVNIWSEDMDVKIRG